MGRLDESWPVRDGGVLLLEDDLNTHSCLGPLRFLRNDFCEQLQGDCVLFTLGLCINVKLMSFEVNLLALGVSNLDVDEYLVLPLSPLDVRVLGHLGISTIIQKVGPDLNKILETSRTLLAWSHRLSRPILCQRYQVDCPISPEVSCLTAVLYRVQKWPSMSKITEELLRKRAEHNEGMLSTLEEISLHQQEISKIENLDILCRHLKILYLQNNIIEKLENLNKLKELEYLNVALNNISMIENIEGCESLKKIDFTVNFIDAEDLRQSVTCLSKLPLIKQLYLTGNPCEDWKGCQDYVIARVPQLETYNGTSIPPSRRIKAVQQLQDLEKDLYHFSEMRKIQNRKKEIDQQQQRQRRISNGQKEDQKQPYTKQTRRKMYQDQADDKERKEKNRNPQRYKEPTVTPMFTQNGQIRQCNQGRYAFRLAQSDDPDYSFFQVQIPKFMDTSEVTVNIDPKWVSVRVKGKLTQMRLSEEIIVSESSVQRAQITGMLIIKMKKLSSQPFLKSKTQQKMQQQLQKRKEKQITKEKQQSQRSVRLRLCEQFQSRKEVEDDDDDVPPLE